MRTLAQRIASTLAALHNCERSGNVEWAQKHSATLDALGALLPSGAGIDSGTKIDRDNPLPRQLRLRVPYHHMTSEGYYDGWTDYVVLVTPDWDGVSVEVKGRDRNGTKEYLSELYADVLSLEVTL